MTTTSDVTKKLSPEEKLQAVQAYLHRGDQTVRDVAERVGLKIPTLMYYVNQYKRTGNLDGHANRTAAAAAKKKRAEPTAIVVQPRARAAKSPTTLLDHSLYDRGIEDYILENRELRKENQRLRRALNALLE